MQSSICHNNKREKLTPEFSDINTGCWLPKIKESKIFAAVLFPLDITLYLHCLHIFTQEILNWKPIVNHKDWVPSIKLIFMGMRQFFFFVNKKMKISGFKKGHFFQSLNSLTLMCQPTLLYRGPFINYVITFLGFLDPPPPPYVSMFLVLRISKNWHFLTPPPPLQVLT